MEKEGEIGKNKSRVDVKSLKTTAIMHFTGRVPVSIVFVHPFTIAPTYSQWPTGGNLRQTFLPNNEKKKSRRKSFHVHGEG